GTTTTSELRIILRKKLSHGFCWSPRSGSPSGLTPSAGLNTLRLSATLRSKAFACGLSSSTVCLRGLDGPTALIGPRNVSRQVSLSGGRQRNLTGRTRDRPAAQCDALDFGHRKFD